MNVLEELIEFADQINRDHVAKRVEDWEQRIAQLYADVIRWLPIDWEATLSGEVPMQEELMRNFDIPMHRLPILRLDQNGVNRGRLEPRGLWIIGVNGRIDLTLPDRHYLIIDRAENFETPDWKLSDLRDVMNEVPFQRDSFLKTLA